VVYIGLDLPCCRWWPCPCTIKPRYPDHGIPQSHQFHP
jgi:hypothetical protein